MKTMQMESWTKLPVNNFVLGHSRIFYKPAKAYLNLNRISFQLSAAVFMTIFGLNYFTNCYYIIHLVKKDIEKLLKFL
jgi:hypothetical protein